MGTIVSSSNVTMERALAAIEAALPRRLFAQAA